MFPNQDPYLPAGVTQQMIDDHFGDALEVEDYEIMSQDEEEIEVYAYFNDGTEDKYILTVDEIQGKTIEEAILSNPH